LSIFLIKKKNYIELGRNYNYASLWVRLIAAIIDIIFLFIISKFLGQLTLVITPFIIWFYFGFFQSSKLQATIGMKILKLKIVDENQEKIGFWRASVCLFSSSIFSVPSLLMIHALILEKYTIWYNYSGFTSSGLKLIIVSILTFFGIFIILLTKRNQGLHNFISRTLVIKV
tara:strand:+ start:136 stop:651 length:516 start_codon:yes stop_codon:yes gene_type:complete